MIGCLRSWVSPLIWGITAVMIGAVMWFSSEYTEALWAPGHLSRHHTDVGSCLSCHQPFQGPIPQKCHACHSQESFAKHAEPDVSNFHADIIASTQPCLTCHIEHRGVLASITTGAVHNPHGEFIFRATGATSCSDCHLWESEVEGRKMTLLSNARVSHILEEGEGAHRPGYFSKCLHCHRGGQLDIDDNEHGDDEAVEG